MHDAGLVDDLHGLGKYANQAASILGREWHSCSMLRERRAVDILDYRAHDTLGFNDIVDLHYARMLQSRQNGRFPTLPVEPRVIGDGHRDRLDRHETVD